MTALDLLQFLGQRLGLDGMFAHRDLADGRLLVEQHLGHAGLMLVVERLQFVEDVMATLDAWMMKDLSAGHYLEGNAAQTQTDLDATVASILVLGRPLGRQHPEIVVAANQVVRDPEDGGAQRAVAGTQRRTVGFVYLVALIAGRSQASSTMLSLALA